MNENRRSYKSEEKLKIVIEGLSGSVRSKEGSFADFKISVSFFHVRV
ncbi:MAG: hypothetical protein ACYDAO_02980 [Thermoplasmataceae archaeon]